MPLENLGGTHFAPGFGMPDRTRHNIRAKFHLAGRSQQEINRTRATPEPYSVTFPKHGPGRIRCLRSAVSPEHRQLPVYVMRPRCAGRSQEHVQIHRVMQRFIKTA